MLSILSIILQLQLGVNIKSYLKLHDGYNKF